MCSFTIMGHLKTLTAIFGLVLALNVAGSAQVDLSAIDGTRINIQGQRGKVVVLAVGASWLPLSEKQSDYLNSLAKRYAGRDVSFYFIATDSVRPGSKNFASDEQIKTFAIKNKLTMPVLRDSDGAATLKRFKIEQVPSFVVLDKNGALVGEPFGGIDPKYDVTIPISKTIDKVL